MNTFLVISQILLSVTLVTLILIQARGTGLGRTFGQTTSFTRRGLEKATFRVTFIISALFLVVSILSAAF